MSCPSSKRERPLSQAVSMGWRRVVIDAEDELGREEYWVGRRSEKEDVEGKVGRVELRPGTDTGKGSGGGI